MSTTNEIQFILYQLPEEEGVIQVVVKDETIWATQKAMASLFGVGVPAVSKHMRNILEEGELDENSVVSKMEITTQNSDCFHFGNSRNDICYYSFGE